MLLTVFLEKRHSVYSFQDKVTQHVCIDKVILSPLVLIICHFWPNWEFTHKLSGETSRTHWKSHSYFTLLLGKCVIWWDVPDEFIHPFICSSIPMLLHPFFYPLIYSLSVNMCLLYTQLNNKLHEKRNLSILFIILSI